MATLTLVDQGVIFRNPLPGHLVVNGFLPFVHVFDSDHWLCVLRTGGAFYSRDGRLEIFRTTDAGGTWRREGPLWARDRDDRHYNDREGCLTALRDGTLVARLSRVAHDDAGQLMFNPKTGGMLPRQMCVSRSTDQGRTWSAPVVAALQHDAAPELEVVPGGAMIELADGRWFQAFETWKTYDNDGPFDLQTYAMFSTDGGTTWDGWAPIARGTAQDRSYSHGRPIQTVDGRVLVILWTADAQQNQFFDLHAVRSADARLTAWAQPRALSIPGQTQWPVDLGDGRLALVYCHREKTEKPGIKVVLSSDGGQTWDHHAPLLLWDAYGREALGAPPTDNYPSSHDAIAYGAPQACRLDSDELLVSFWCTLGPDTHCRWCRVGCAS